MTPYPYIFICRMIDHYRELVEQSRSEEERIIRKQSLMMYENEFKAYHN